MTTKAAKSSSTSAKTALSSCQARLASSLSRPSLVLSRRLISKARYDRCTSYDPTLYFTSARDFQASAFASSCAAAIQPPHAYEARLRFFMSLNLSPVPYHLLPSDVSRIAVLYTREGSTSIGTHPRAPIYILHIYYTYTTATLHCHFMIWSI